MLSCGIVMNATAGYSVGCATHGSKNGSTGSRIVVVKCTVIDNECCTGSIKSPAVIVACTGNFGICKFHIIRSKSNSSGNMNQTATCGSGLFISCTGSVKSKILNG